VPILDLHHYFLVSEHSPHPGLTRRFSIRLRCENESGLNVAFIWRTLFSRNFQGPGTPRKFCVFIARSLGCLQGAIHFPRDLAPPRPFPSMGCTMMLCTPGTVSCLIDAGFKGNHLHSSEKYRGAPTDSFIRCFQASRLSSQFLNDVNSPPSTGNPRFILNACVPFSGPLYLGLPPLEELRFFGPHLFFLFGVQIPPRA